MASIFRRAIAKQVAKVIGAAADDLVSMVTVTPVTKKINPDAHFSLPIRNLVKYGFIAESNVTRLDETACKMANKIVCDNPIMNVTADRSVLQFKVNHPLMVKLNQNEIHHWCLVRGLLGVGFLKYGSESQLSQNAIQHLFDIYVRVNQDADKDETVYDSARQFFKNMEEGDEKSLSLWQRFRELSIDEYSRIYQRLGVGFDVYSGESMFGDPALQVIEQVKKMGILQLSKRGTGVVDLTADNSMKFYSTLMRSDGTTLYITRDIAAAIHRHDNYKFNRMYYVVDKSQNQHFRQLFGTLNKMKYEWADRCHHVQFGKVIGMSTRKGDVIFLQDVLDEAKTRMLHNMKYSQTTKVDNLDEVAEALGISAIIIQDLKNNLNSDYKFDWDKVLQSHGDTGVYLQYSHARLCSIEKLCNISLDTNCNTTLLQEKEATQLVQQIAAYEDAVYKAYTEIEPKNIVKYLFRLCHVASTAHNTLMVKGSNTDLAKARLLLFNSARLTLSNGMRLLGILPLQQM
uniref:Probable arginine--tRNA ligase, mitochondrial n=1 Tax=Saccoglossus kowalevskii TaxID=10224 RepID=A0ABM0MGZ0_SACKO|nr:PREDICTED: probable arginine--tRNA ligase, mitochondrial-like [Saccoglossus kowalevskii]